MNQAELIELLAQAVSKIENLRVKLRQSNRHKRYYKLNLNTLLFFGKDQKVDSYIEPNKDAIKNMTSNIHKTSARKSIKKKNKLAQSFFNVKHQPCKEMQELLDDEVNEEKKN